MTTTDQCPRWVGQVSVCVPLPDVEVTRKPTRLGAVAGRLPTTCCVSVEKGPNSMLVTCSWATPRNHESTAVCDAIPMKRRSPATEVARTRTVPAG